MCASLKCGHFRLSPAEAEVSDLKLAEHDLSCASVLFDWLLPFLLTSSNKLSLNTHRRLLTRTKAVRASQGSRLLLMQVAHVRGEAELLATQAKCHVIGPIKQTEVSTKAAIFLRAAPHFYGFQRLAAQCCRFPCNLESAFQQERLLKGTEETK